MYTTGWSSKTPGDQGDTNPSSGSSFAASGLESAKAGSLMSGIGVAGAPAPGEGDSLDTGIVEGVPSFLKSDPPLPT